MFATTSVTRWATVGTTNSNGSGMSHKLGIWSCFPTAADHSMGMISRLRDSTAITLSVTSQSEPGYDGRGHGGGR